MDRSQGPTIDLPSREGSNFASLSPQLPSAGGTPRSVAPLASKATSILSSSYSDTEFRGALALLDERKVLNDAETRRRIRLDLQKEVIDSNGEIIGEFGRVAEVGPNPCALLISLSETRDPDVSTAIEKDKSDSSEVEYQLRECQKGHHPSSS